MTCREYFTADHWCGKFWYGRVLKCSSCEQQEQYAELLDLQKAKLKLEIKALETTAQEHNSNLIRGNA